MPSDTPVGPHIDDHVFGRWVLGFAKPNGTSARVGLIIAVAAACAIVATASTWFGLPALPGFDGSILHQPSPLAAFAVIAILLLITTLLGTIIAGAVRFEAGLFAATFSLVAISLRCGTMQSVLFETGGNESVYNGLILELLIFTAFIVGLWTLLWLLRRAHLAYANSIPDPDRFDSTLLDRLTALITQIVATGVLMMFLCQSVAKNQSLASIALSSFLATVLAYKYAPVRPSIWYWIGPLIVGLIGYTLAAMGQDANLAIGSPAGSFASLARPLPIDYASAGPAGAILAYWMMRKKEVVTA